MTSSDCFRLWTSGELTRQRPRLVTSRNPIGLACRPAFRPDGWPPAGSRRSSGSVRLYAQIPKRMPHRSNARTPVALRCAYTTCRRPSCRHRIECGVAQGCPALQAEQGAQEETGLQLADGRASGSSDVIAASVVVLRTSWTPASMPGTAASSAQGRIVDAGRRTRQITRTRTGCWFRRRWAGQPPGSEAQRTRAASRARSQRE